MEAKNGMKLTCETDYPYGFDISYKIDRGGKLAVRIPKWSENFSVTVNGGGADVQPVKGYIFLDVSDGDTVNIALDGAPKFAYGSVKVPAFTGKIAVTRGPLVYCFEGADNGDVLSLSLKRGGELTPENYGEIAFGEVSHSTVKITADAVRRDDTDTLYTDSIPNETICKAAAIPYYTWGNRGENQMRVWIPEHM